MKASWGKAWGVAAVCALLVAASTVGVATYLTRARPAADVEPGDRLTAAIEGLERDSFYVAPELRDRLTDDDVAAIRRAVRSSEEPFYLAYMTDTTSAGYYQNYNAVEIIADHIGEDGLYAIADERQRASATSRGMEFPYIEAQSLLGRDAVGLERYAHEVASAPPEPEDKFDFWGGPRGGVSAGLLFGVLGYVALLLLAGMTRRRTS